MNSGRTEWNGRPLTHPTPRELKALRAVADGSSLSEAAQKLETTTSRLASVLSCLYLRLGITNRSSHHLSQDRRSMAIKIGKKEGWWTE